jgi:recombination protein RecA
MGVNAKILEKSGAWYAYNGEKIGQGRDNSREFLRENPALAIEIENKVREAWASSCCPWTVLRLPKPSLPRAARARWTRTE